jgi:hypothetical protein
MKDKKAWYFCLTTLLGSGNCLDTWYNAKAHALRYIDPKGYNNPMRERICLLPVSVNFPDSARDNESNALLKGVN